MSSQPQRPSVTAEDELAAAIGADRALMLRQVPADVRPAFEALWQIDAAMGDVVARSTQPALGAVKLAGGVNGFRNWTGASFPRSRG